MGCASSTHSYGSSRSSSSRSSSSSSSAHGGGGGADGGYDDFSPLPAASRANTDVSVAGRQGRRRRAPCRDEPAPPMPNPLYVNSQLSSGDEVDFGNNDRASAESSEDGAFVSANGATHTTTTTTPHTPHTAADTKEGGKKKRAANHSHPSTEGSFDDCEEDFPDDFTGSYYYEEDEEEYEEGSYGEASQEDDDGGSDNQLRSEDTPAGEVYDSDTSSDAAAAAAAVLENGGSSTVVKPGLPLLSPIGNGPAGDAASPPAMVPGTIACTERSPDPANEDDLSSITSSTFSSENNHSAQALPTFGGGHRHSAVDAFVPPEQFVFSDFDVPTNDDAEERLARSLQRRDSRFNFGDYELDHETEVESTIVKRYLQIHRKSGGVVDDSFLWGDFNLDVEEITKQHQIHREFTKQRKAIDGVTLHNHLGLPDRVKCLAVLPGETVYAACDCNCATMRTFDTKTGELRLSFIGHQEPITFVCFSPNCKHIATASADGGVVVWDTVTTKAQSILPHPKAVASCAFTGNSKSLVTSCWDNICRTWEIRKRKLLRLYTEHGVFVFALDTHPKYDVVVSGGVDGTIMLWTSLTATTKAVLRGHTGAVLSVKFSPQGTRIVSNDETSIRIWNTMTTVCVVALSIDVLPFELNVVHPRRRTWIASGFCPVGIILRDEQPSLHVIASCSDKSVHVLQASTGKPVYSFACRAPVYQIASGARSTVVCGDCYGNVVVARIR